MNTWLSWRRYIALMMACYLIGHRYWMCYYVNMLVQTISCLLGICWLQIIDISLGVIWDAYLLWIQSIYKFTNAYSKTWNEIWFPFYAYWLNIVILVNLGADSLLTPVLTFEYADCKCYWGYISCGEGFYIFDGYYNGRWWPSKIRLKCLFDTWRRVWFLLASPYSTWSSCSRSSSFIIRPLCVLSSHVLSDLWTIKPFKQLRVRSLWPPATMIKIMMTSSNGNIFRVTGHLCGECTGLRWIPRTKTSDAELWCFIWSVSK